MGTTVLPAAAASNEEHNILRESAAAFCAGDAGVQRLKALKQTDRDFDPQVWRSMVELGWTAILVPEDCDGLGLDLAAAAIVAEQLGRVAAPEPMLEVAGVAVSLLAALQPGEPRRTLLSRTAAGEIMPLACTSEYQRGARDQLPKATQATAGYVLNGCCEYVALARNADGFLVPAMLDTGETGLFWIPANTHGLSIDSHYLADNTTHATLQFDDVTLDETAVLGRGEAAETALSRSLETAQILSAACLCGVMDAALETTLDYLRTRKQFGRAIGSFQALQHRTVDLYIQREISNAVVADVIREIGAVSDSVARSILAGRAKYRASESALAITRAAIQLHGAIGYTYECDIGHFVNRAMTLSSRYGNVSWQLRTLGERLRAVDTGDAPAAKNGTAVAEPAHSDWNSLSDEDFRRLVRTWFETHYPDELRYPPRRLRWHEIKPWYLELSAKGWLAPSWPVEFGGMGLSPSKVLVFIEEQERWGVARAPDMGITMIGPLLIQHGSEAQRAYYLPKILAGEHVWCQGYSEPNAGSDLASLQCAAILDGDEFVVNGQKTWTTMAHDATHIFLLVRTDKTVKQQAGISFLLLDINSPGISIRPIRNLSGDEEFCEVFFDDVRVPAENLVGELNTGWSIAKALLSFERIFLGSPKQSQYALGRLDCIANGRGLFDDPGFIDRYTKLKLDTMDLESIYARFAEIVRDGGTLGPDVSLLKVWATETFARLSELMVEAAGDMGVQRGDLDFGAGKANIMSQFYNARPATIYGGSNEIQRNIIAKNVLQLPDR